MDMMSSCLYPRNKKEPTVFAETTRENILILEIGGGPVRITSLSPSVLSGIRESCSNFVCHMPKNMKGAIHVHVEESPPAVSRPAGPGIVLEEPAIGHDVSTGKWTISQGDAYGEFYPAHRKGRFSYSPGLHGIGFDSFLRFACSFVLTQENAFLIHASALIRGGNAYLFPGRSGAGKTTIVKLSSDAVLLSDDIPIVMIGQDNVPMVCGTPFRSSFNVQGENASAPLAGIYFPVKDTKNFTIPLGKTRALLEFMPPVVLYGSTPRYAERIFDLCAMTIMKVPAFELHFLPDPAFWECIDA